MEFVKVEKVPYNTATVTKLKAFLEQHGLDKAILGKPIEGNVPMYIALVVQLDVAARRVLMHDLDNVADEIYYCSDVEELDVDNSIGTLILDSVADITMFGSEYFYKEDSFWQMKL